jgi:hypothetical protein
MTNQDWHNTPLPKREAVVHPRRRRHPASHRGAGYGDGRYLAAYRRLLARHKLLIRRVCIGGGIALGLLLAGGGGLWWRLNSGPIQLDVATPWLAAAIAQNFGSQHHVEVGGTQIERTENGGAAVRIRDIVVRDPDGTVVASAPKAEVHVSAMSLLSGHMRAESLNLVGAEMAVRIERDGDVTVFAGANKRPLVTASAPLGPAPLGPGTMVGGTTPSTATPAAVPPRRASDVFAALLAWIDGIGEAGLDGHELRELGLKDGNLTVDDERTGKRWSFRDITLSLDRPHGGGVVVSIGSDNAGQPWGLTAAIKPTQNGAHAIELEGRHVSAGDLLLAARIGDGSIETNLPVSASLRGEIGSDGVPRNLTGRIVAESGFVSGAGDDDRIDIDHAEFKLSWDAMNRVLAVPFQIVSGGNRMTLMAEVRPPDQPSGVWAFKLGGGSVVLNSGTIAGDALVLNRIAVAGSYDPIKRRFVINDGGFAGNGEVGVEMSGKADFVNGDLHVAGGFAATSMTADSLKRLWPIFVSPKVRDWFNTHLSSGNIDHIVIAVNAPFNTLQADGPPVPDGGLSIDALATNCVIAPVKGLPALHDADLNVHIVGRDAVITVNKATADLPSGKKLTLSAGQFEVPDTAPHAPPAQVHFKLDGPVPAAAELLAMDRLRDASGVPFDPATTRGTMSALVTLGMPLRPDLPPGSTNYAISVDATNFVAEHMIMGQKLEAAALKVSANNLGFEIKGDAKIGATPITLDYRKTRDDNDADISLSGMLDETARSSLGLDPTNSISGSIPMRVIGRMGSGAEREGRFSVEADLTSAQIEGFLPGWFKPPGKPARAIFTLTTKPQSIAIDDLLIEGAGGGVKGNIELDGSGQLQSANFPSYGFADGDRASMKVDRAPDGALRVVMRGDVYDGRGFVRTVTGGPSGTAPAKRPVDIDLDMKIGAVEGFNGEAVRSLDLKMSRRAGEIRSFGLSARIGRDAPLTGDLRSRSDGRQVIALATNDGGALFRFTDVYARLTGGQMALTMDAPSPNNTLQQGTISLRNFAVHDETQLENAVSSNGGPVQNNVMDFSSMKVNFDRSSGRVVLRDGVVRGPVLGATIDGLVDYARDEIRMRGTLVPLYGPNNLLGSLPIVGLFLGGDKEGLVGITYEVVGKPGNPVLHVNPFSALAPGLLRKVFEYPANAPFSANPPFTGNAPYSGSPAYTGSTNNP